MILSVVDKTLLQSTLLSIFNASGGSPAQLEQAFGLTDQGLRPVEPCKHSMLDLASAPLDRGRSL